MTPLRAYRKDRGLRLREIKDIIGVSESQLSRIERDGTPKIEIARRLSVLTGHPLESFQKALAA